MRVDIAIIGAGLVGAMLALWLRKNTDFSIAVIERTEQMSAPKELNKRVVALGGLATSMLEEVGVLNKLGDECCHAYQSMYVWDQNSDGVLEFDASLVGDAQLGHMIDSLRCTYELQQRINNTNEIQSFFDTQIEKMGSHGERVSILTNGGEINAGLVVGADGVNSWVRKNAKIFANRQNYGQRGIVAKIESSESHQNCAWQRFLNTGPLAILPLANNMSSIVWSANNDEVDELLGLNDAQFETALERALQGRLGSVKLLDRRQAFPLVSQRAEKYYTRNVVLVGDAAHSIHPLAGQGANLGFKDVLCLGRELSKSSAKNLGSPRVLERYQAIRQADNTQTDTLMSFLNLSYQFDLPLWMAARGLGMNFINRIHGLRQFLATQATGK